MHYGHYAGRRRTRRHRAGTAAGAKKAAATRKRNAKLAAAGQGFASARAKLAGYKPSGSPKGSKKHSLSRRGRIDFVPCRNAAGKFSSRCR
jgi:hypothetical protein